MGRKRSLNHYQYPSISNAPVPLRTTALFPLLFLAFPCVLGFESYCGPCLPHSSMTRLSTWILAFLRRLLSFTRSIKHLWVPIHAILRRFSKARPSHQKDTRQARIPRPSHTNDLPISDVICPSLQPPRETESTSIHVPSHDFEQHTPNPVHSPTPKRGYLLPYAYENQQGSHIGALTKEQDIGAETPEDYNHDTVSISTHRSASLPSFSNVSLPVAFHGLSSNSSRPEARNSQSLSLLRPASRASQPPNSPISKPLKVSRPPTPASANMALPPLRIVVPMSTASLQRYDRNIIV